MRASSYRLSRYARRFSFMAALVFWGCGDSTSPPAATTLAFVRPPATVFAGAPISPAVLVAIQDSRGETLRDATTAVTIAIEGNPANGILSGTTTVNAVQGIATFSDLRINRSGVAYTLAATATGLPKATSASFTVSAAPAAKLAFATQPVSGIAGDTIPSFTILVQDAEGNIATSASNSIALSLVPHPSGATITGVAVRAAVNGVAVFSGLRVTRPGTGFTIRAATSTLEFAASAPFEMRIGPPSRLAFRRTPVVASTGAALDPSVAVEVQDVGGNTITTGSYNVSLALQPGSPGGVLAGTTVVPTVAGVATFTDLKITSDGEYRFVATTPDITGSAVSDLLVIRDSLALTMVSAGYFHTCGLAASGTAQCWGNNSEGQLGTTGTQSLIAIPVSGGLNFTMISAGRSHSCGVTTLGLTYCWGSGLLGQLGNNGSSAVPRVVQGASAFKSVLAGYDHTCALTEAGTAYCWGDNSAGELGAQLQGGPVPVAVAGGLSFKSISPGRLFTCGLTADGIAHCWGDNANGELGNGGTARSFTPVTVKGELTFSVIGAGGFHACGLTTAGKAYCWGGNATSQLGSEVFTGTASTEPVEVSGSLTFVALSVGNRHTCALTASGQAYCWGENQEGKLGDGTFITRQKPTLVSGDLTFVNISAGRFHTCGVTQSSSVYCWGGNGLLGDGTTATSNVPLRVR